jgi:hypothetical protein
MRVPDSSAPGREPHGGDTSRGQGTPDSFTVWRLFGTLGELLCSVRVTSYGYALVLELTGEPILLEVEGSLEELVTKAVRLERWLLTQGWIALSDD